MTELEKQFQTPMVNLLLSIADDKLFLGHRNSDWTGIAPILEADIAFSSLAQDDIAHASAIYQLIHTLTGEDPDQIAFHRTECAYLCADIVTKSDDFNWASAIARQFYCNTFDFLRLQRLGESSWVPLSSLAKRLCAEQAIHVDHVHSWIDHLGKGNEDSAARIQTALDTFAPYAAMLFEKPEGLDTLHEADVLADHSDFFTAWISTIETTINNAGLALNIQQSNNKGGRNGVHDADFTLSLSELQEVFSTDPLAAW
ncbi:MAG: phenylacetate-CoA oxygenase subunit PaaC [Phycisphaerae bacterium]|nr:phenylacetate-CoA oxygenase subunit PaaC [Phycisphaerae bacterium]